jgi:hypothetical protein
MIDALVPFAGAEVAPETHEQFDSLEKRMLSEFPAVDLPLIHRFTPGLYVREIFMPAGTLCTSKIHKTEHPYVVLTGKALVLIPGQGVELIEAGKVGITQPGTRRLLAILEDCRWLTFHPIEEEEQGDLQMIEDRIIERRELADGQTIFEHYQELLHAAEAGLLSENPHGGGD